MPWYLTEYKADWSVLPRGAARVGNYGATLWAKNRERAGRVAKKRGLNERVLARRGRPDYLPADMMCQRYMQQRTLEHFTDAMHALSFLGMLAMASGVAKPAEILGDEGILHNFIHLRLPGAFVKRWDVIRQEIKDIQSRVPGYLAPQR